MCQEFCPGGGMYIPAWIEADNPLSRHPPGQTPPGKTHPSPGQTPPGRHPLPPWADPRADIPPEMATAADGTHPTGMHSCSSLNLWCQGEKLCVALVTIPTHWVSSLSFENVIRPFYTRLVFNDTFTGLQEPKVFNEVQDWPTWTHCTVHKRKRKGFSLLSGARKQTPEHFKYPHVCPFLLLCHRLRASRHSNPPYCVPIHGFSHQGHILMTMNKFWIFKMEKDIDLLVC